MGLGKQIIVCVVAAIFIAFLACIWGFLQTKREREEGTAESCSFDCSSCMTAGCANRKEEKQ